MFERFTDRARRVVVLAQEEARRLNHGWIGTEHILLGLAAEGEGVAARALAVMGISLDALRQQVEEIIGKGEQAQQGSIPFTPRGKKVIELSLRESLQLGHNYIGTEHLLLALIREGEGVAAQVLIRLGADLAGTRQAVVRLLNGDYPDGSPRPAPAGTLEAFLADPSTPGYLRELSYRPALESYFWRKVQLESLRAHVRGQPLGQALADEQDASVLLARARAVIRAWAALDRAERQVAAAMDGLGMTPASRFRLGEDVASASSEAAGLDEPVTPHPPSPS